MNLSQLAGPAQPGVRDRTLEFILISAPFYPNISILHPPGSLGHCVITYSIVFIGHSTLSFSLHTFWRYSSANLDDLRHFLASYPWNDFCFIAKVFTSFILTDIVLQRMSFLFHAFPD